MLSKMLGSWRLPNRTLAEALAAAIRDAVVDGRIRPGDALPAERRMAAELRVSRGTVTSVLAALRDEGWIDTRHGSASRVRLPDGLGERYAPAQPRESAVLDMSQAVPAAPREAYTAALWRAAQRSTRLLIGDGQPDIGLEELRERIAARYTAEGLATGADQILVTSGARAALALLVAHSRPRRVAVENPAFHDTLRALQRFGPGLSPVAVSADGWDPTQLDTAFREVSGGMASLVPDFQNPTGALMDERQRDTVAALARRYGVTVVTDETMREIDLRDEPDPPRRIPGAVAVGSLGKTVWGGLRIGWIRAPAKMIQALRLDPLHGPYSPPPMEQLIAAELLDVTGDLLRRRRQELRQQRDHLVRQLAARTDFQFQVPDGGLVLWLRCAEVSSIELAARSEEYGLALSPGPHFSPNRTLQRWLRLPYTAPTSDLDEAVRRLRDLTAAVRAAG